MTGRSGGLTAPRMIGQQKNLERLHDGCQRCAAAALSAQSSFVREKDDTACSRTVVNVMALCICTQEAVKLMQEKNINDGQIIHISSMGGHRLPANMPGANFYCGTKFMVKALTEGLRRELKALKSHIRIGSISPGMVETEFFDHFLKNDPTRKASDLFSSMKALQSDDIAESVLYILRAPPHVEVHDILVRPYDQAL
ncbi:Dehydrogenase/reductase SDR family member 11 [Araneus ventricosus]|uniref:Dehydrogenase/reductase SDR family member 11 n=1 Tax=Araneus ventricosus TaxID=182803 RepID=A0A4Y2SIG6_ARAVE|nr:Dehydrogenase/reductase SDR family member 11 [Araneus ventricosus]GBN87062.1 Dehydrogenase/reductase SDR family member 11 [Araneus ventricosus]